MADTEKAVPEKPEVKTEFIKLVFIYVKIDRQGKKNYWYWLLTDEPNDGASLGFNEDKKQAKVYTQKKPWLVGLQPGAIVGIQRVLDESKPDSCVVYPNTARIQGQWECEQDVTEWQTVHRAESLAFEAKKANKEFDFSELDWLRKRYRKLTARKQKAFLVNLLHWLDKPPGLFERQDD